MTATISDTRALSLPQRRKIELHVFLEVCHVQREVGCGAAPFLRDCPKGTVHPLIGHYRQYVWLIGKNALLKVFSTKRRNSHVPTRSMPVAMEKHRLIAAREKRTSWPSNNCAYRQARGQLSILVSTAIARQENHLI
jgi:hypothetical protein